MENFLSPMYLLFLGILPFHINATKFRRTVATVVREKRSGLASDVADLMCHSKNTADVMFKLNYNMLEIIRYHMQIRQLELALDLLQVSLLINKQTGGRRRRKGRGRGRRARLVDYALRKRGSIFTCSSLIGSSANMKESRRSRS